MAQLMLASVHSTSRVRELAYPALQLTCFTI
nr:MAG TPA: hypothetical protein [Crassvirales sp.]